MEKVAFLVCAHVSGSSISGSNDTILAVCGGNFRHDDNRAYQLSLHRLLRRIVSRTRILKHQIRQTLDLYTSDRTHSIPIITNHPCIDDIMPRTTTTEVNPDNLSNDLSGDYNIAINMYAGLRLIQVQEESRAYLASYQPLENILKDILCAMHRALASFGDQRSRDLHIVPSIDSCEASTHFEKIYRNWMILRNMYNLANQLFDKYSVHKRLHVQ